MKYFVQIKSYGDDSVVKEIECKSSREAVVVADGADINLDHENYYTEVVERDERV